MDAALKATKNCALAVWSLVLGILSLVCCGLFAGIPAVICGHLAQSRIRDSKGTVGGGGLAISGLVTGYIGTVLTTIMLLGLLAGMLLPALAAARDRAQRASCVSNLKQIGLAARMYSADHQEVFPNELKSLTAYIGNSPELFICPAKRRKAGELAAVDEWADYVIVPNRKESDPANTVLGFSKPHCYPGKGGNILFVDGHVEWVSLDEYNKLTTGLTR